MKIIYELGFAMIIITMALLIQSFTVSPGNSYYETVVKISDDVEYKKGSVTVYSGDTLILLYDGYEDHLYNVKKHDVYKYKGDDIEIDIRPIHAGSYVISKKENGKIISYCGIKKQ